jgi:hypothetical protein
MNPNDYQRCWTVGEYVLAQTMSSLTWICIAGAGGVALMLLRKRIRPMLERLRGDIRGDRVVRPHFVSASCAGERCRCGSAATHKLSEVIQHDDPDRVRHELVAYVCCDHFEQVVGPAAPCFEK